MTQMRVALQGFLGGFPSRKKRIFYVGWCHCNFLRVLKPTGLATLSSTLGVFLKHKNKTTGLHGYFRTSSSIIWPHELFAGLWEHHPRAFRDHILGGDPKEVAKFWSTMPPRPHMEHKDGWHYKVVPLSLHGDGISIANIRGKAAKTVDCLSWSSLLSTGPTRYTSYLIWFCFTHMVKQAGLATTWGHFWSKLCQSLQILWSGIWPEKDFHGRDHPKANQPLAGGFCAIVYINKGDLEWMSKHFHLAHPSSGRPCSLCRATNHGPDDPVPWTDANNNPSWLPTCLTDQVFSREPRKPDLPGCKS